MRRLRRCGRAAPATRLLAEIRRGSPGAEEEFFRLVYGELRRMAASRMAGRREVTLQPTALVNETFLRLFGKEAASYDSRAHFFCTAAKAMRSILVDAARRRTAEKRGAGRTLLALTDSDASLEERAFEVVPVNDALSRLEELDAEAGRVVELRFFGGLTMAETAAALGVTERTAYRRWDRARAWLHRELER